jgi:hypothetical protein
LVLASATASSPPEAVVSSSEAASVATVSSSGTASTTSISISSPPTPSAAVQKIQFYHLRMKSYLNSPAQEKRKKCEDAIITKSKVS